MFSQAISGRQALASIDQAINSERDKLSTLESRIEAVNDELLERQRQQTQDYRDLAKLHLSRIASGELDQQLDQAERQIVRLLEQRQQASLDLKARFESAEAQQQTLEQQRLAQAEKVEQAAQTIDEAEGAIQARLDQDASYQTHKADTEAAKRQAVHAEEKARLSDDELEQKGESYRKDPLFSYLWDRHYGLPAYASGGLIRWLDSKVARLIGYADARLNFQRLNEIPERLSHHAGAVRAKADAAFAELKDLDEAARAADGLPKLEAALLREQSTLDGIDLEIAQIESRIQDLHRERADFNAGRDGHTQKAITFLASEFARDDFTQLRREAMSTPLPDDDLIVARMRERQTEAERLDTTLGSIQGTVGQHQQRLSELEALRVEFKQNRYDSAGSVFGDGSAVNMLLSEFIDGLLDRKHLWRVLSRQHRYQPRHSNPGYGSGGYGKGTVWNSGLGDLSDLGDIFSSGGGGGFGGGGLGGGGLGGGGGGFRTGGGF